MAKTNKRVLIIEDDEAILSILKQNFSEEGFDVITAQDGKEPLNMLEKEKPDFIISDVLLPGQDGVEMAKKIRALKIETPIIFLTNTKDDGRAKDITNSEYLIKANIYMKDVVSKVKKQLDIQ
jgi:two-component system alkaline phosphatase synthesis response regulator PhoP